jgi:hypothetical protein
MELKMILFHSLFPEIAEKETRYCTITEPGQLPVGEYAFVDSYCPEVHCDCRRVLVNVIRRDSKRIWATINYGWESVEFYRNWSPVLTDLEGQGPFLDLLGEQSELAPELMKLFAQTCLQDPAYIARLAHHYDMVKGYAASQPSAYEQKMAKRRQRAKTRKRQNR